MQYLTHELKLAASLASLYSGVTRVQHRFQTAVYTIETGTGACINPESAFHKRKKIGVINSLLHSGLHGSLD